MTLVFVGILVLLVAYVAAMILFADWWAERKR